MGAFTMMLVPSLLPRLYGASGEDTHIAVAVSSNAPAFEEAVAAFKMAMSGDGVQVLLVQLDDKDPDKELAGVARPRVAIAFGSRASQALDAADASVPLVISMVLANDAAPLIKPQQLVST